MTKALRLGVVSGRLEVFPRSPVLFGVSLDKPSGEFGFYAI